MAGAGRVQKWRLKMSKATATADQTTTYSQVSRVRSAPVGQRSLVLMLPSVAWAMRVMSTLPAAWLNSHAYQKVTATVVSAS